MGQGIFGDLHCRNIILQVNIVIRVRTLYTARLLSSYTAGLRKEGKGDHLRQASRPEAQTRMRFRVGEGPDQLR